MQKLSLGGFANSQGTAACGKKAKAIDVEEVRDFKTCGIIPSAGLFRVVLRRPANY
jgi:hypothetical protein